MDIKPIDWEAFLLGTAIGDAFGAGVEFQDKNWIRAHVDFSTFVNARHLIHTNEVESAVFTQNYQPWDYTDDTEMTIGLLKALISGNPFSADLLVEYWIKEYHNGVVNKGYGRNGHGSMRWVFSGEKSITELRAFQQTRPNPGNAPVMRAAPLGALPDELINSYAAINADATHPHPKARAAGIVTARAAAFIWKNLGDKKDIIHYCLQYIRDVDHDTCIYLQKVDRLPSPKLINDDEHAVLLGPQPLQPPFFPKGINGLPSDAVYTGGAVLWILKHATSVTDALKTAIYLGGDVDSIASVCTGILAGKYGLTGIPQFMLDEVEGKLYFPIFAQELTTKISYAAKYIP